MSERPILTTPLPMQIFDMRGKPATLFASQPVSRLITVYLDGSIPEGTAEIRDASDRLIGKIINIGPAP